jgi:hypothetical protein
VCQPKWPYAPHKYPASYQQTTTTLSDRLDYKIPKKLLIIYHHTQTNLDFWLTQDIQAPTQVSRWLSPSMWIPLYLHIYNKSPNTVDPPDLKPPIPSTMTPNHDIATRCPQHRLIPIWYSGETVPNTKYIQGSPDARYQNIYDWTQLMLFQSNVQSSRAHIIFWPPITSWVPAKTPIPCLHFYLTPKNGSWIATTYSCGEF